ncbi:hypothetical protein [Salinibacterium sp. NYA9b]
MTLARVLRGKDVTVSAVAPGLARGVNGQVIVANGALA